MEERVLINKDSIYNSKLNEGIFTLMSLMYIDCRIPVLLEKEKLIEMTIDVLKKMEQAEFPSLAIEVEKQISNLHPNYDFENFRKQIVEYLVLIKMTSIFKIETITNATVSNKKVLKYFDEQLYVCILNCIYSLSCEAAKTLSMKSFSKKMKIGEKTCAALYPQINFEDAIDILEQDLNVWIAYNEMFEFCKIEKNEDSIDLQVRI